MSTGDQKEKNATQSEDELSLEVKKHSAFWLRHLRMLPTPYISGDLQRMTLGYFCIGALDLLNLLEVKVDVQERKEYIDWIYDQQLDRSFGGGFLPGPFLRRDQYQDGSADSSLPSGSRPSGNLAMTYTALLNLAMLGDDFVRLDREAILLHLHSLQQPDGSFAPSLGQDECDCRFVYCAFAVCSMLNAWDSIDVEAAIGFLHSSRSYDGAFAQGPGQESQGGSTYCAVAALSLADKLDTIQNSEQLISWLTARQQQKQGGFNGRIEKDEDACYSFWCGASLEILGSHNLIDSKADTDWLLSCQTKVGGIAKVPDEIPDVMHSYLSLAALAMHAYEEECESSGTRLKPFLRELDPTLNISKHSLERMRQKLT
ncbi:terpenoid cyclases/Protein prenyltransferase [Meira miltonrushii]|uniref:Geranylgeranyl transferase type-1 subunit beta n=1 Tax=Meira miltonrushii TaxID=1280837 RepID=A0A316V3P1_9BASI|nr:terpenoid cyclases/Protein prenyltransferase [Meira miltonrushii]PWN32150.1 terpenoid cyclases/Protein prenyltransferase [Meira miltonrushii]